MFLKNSWYVAASSDEVSRKPMGRVLLGDPVVLYRKEDGTAVALEDRCCHRRAPLHRGEVIGDALQCGYHGFTFDQTGACIKVPGMTTPPKNARVKSYRVIERHKWIWIWFGDATPDESLIPDFHQNDHPQWASARGTIALAANYLLYVDNLLDLSHVGFVHRDVIGSDDADAELKFERRDSLVQGVRQSPDMATPPLYKKLGMGGTVRQKKVMTFTPAAHIAIDITTSEIGDGGKIGREVHIFVLNSITPERENTCHYFWASARDFDIDSETMTELIHSETERAFMQDKDMVESQQKVIDLDPNAAIISVRADSGGLLARRVVVDGLQKESTTTTA
jgi:phenylpropionate dioxygenase-like ring-hydroxylating dioxygenase large terminal subunit